jgi:hypothetical protein
VRGDETARIWQRRLAWLDLQWPGTRPGREHFRPQPFEQLAKMLRAMGHGHDADRIAVAKRRFALKRRADRGVAFALDWILSWTSDFGYAPGRALSRVRGFVLAGWLVTCAGIDRAWIVFADDAEGWMEQPWLQALVFAVNAFVPLFTFAERPELDVAPSWFGLGLILYNLVGIVLTSILVATLTGLLRKD